MAALPYIQFYVADYLADTSHLSTEEHGAYLLLIFNYWQTGKPIPHGRRAAIAGVDADRWPGIEDTLSEFFEESEDGSWTHGRIEKDLQRVRHKSKQASRAGKKSAEVRSKKRKTIKTKAIKPDPTPPVSVTPPTLEEWTEYCKEYGFGHIASRSYHGYAEAGWRNSRDKEIKNWKRTLQQVWFDDEKNPAPLSAADKAKKEIHGDYTVSSEEERNRFIEGLRKKKEAAF